MTDLFSRAVAEIEAAYARLGHQLGWRFLVTPRRTLAGDAEVAFLTLNPGGAADDRRYPRASCEDGSAYRYEAWGGYARGASPLQRQVRAMFAWLGRDPDTTLSAYFIPFRSPTYEQLAAPEQSSQFAVSLWRTIFREVRPELIVCLGADVERGLRGVFEAEGERPLARAPYPVGWEPQKAWVTCYRERVLLRVPHLSRFGIFERPDSPRARHAHGWLRELRNEVEQRQAEVRLRRAGLA
jgi:hypothetical protein